MSETANGMALSGKVALVTGAGSGLGEATAMALAREGCAVGCLDIQQAAAQRVSQALVAGDAASFALACDVASEEAVFAAVAQTVERLGRLDIVVNCAAIDHTLSIDEMTVGQWDQVLDINLRGPFLMAKAALPVMRRQRSGHIVNVASTAATRAWANAAAYHASKWGLVGFGRALGVEGRPDNIRVTTVIPGGMRTHFFDRFVEQGIPMPQEENLQPAANVAAAIVFAVRMPPESVMQEMIVTPLTETSWP
jgi:NAD(P)-dependent dehydrogenase (short-subunit alcohol dehydrogenase family)